MRIPFAAKERGAAVLSMGTKERSLASVAGSAEDGEGCSAEDKAGCSAANWEDSAEVREGSAEVREGSVEGCWAALSSR